MKRKVLVGLCLVASSFAAAAYELKGLKTGLTLSQLNNIMPVECEPETGFSKGDVIHTVCYGDTGTRSEFKTLANQPVSSYVFSLDKSDVVHQITVGISCSANPDIVVRALSEKYGTYSKPFAYSHQWKSRGQLLEFVFIANSKKNCGFVGIQDSTYTKAFSKKTDELIKANSPAKDL